MSDPQNPYNRAYQPTQSYPAPNPAGQPNPAAPNPAGQAYPPGPAYPQAPPYGPGAPYPAPYPPYGPQGHPYGTPRPVPEPRNGFGITALVLALVGLALAFIPFTGFLAVILGGIAVVFGLLGLGRVRSGQATNKVMPIVGAVLGLIAMVVGVIATVLVVSAALRLASGQEAAGASRSSAPTPSLSRAAPLPPLSPSSAPAAPNRQTGPAPGTFTWEDGLAVEVSPPRAVTFSETACCGTSGSGIAFTVRLTNNTGKIVEPYAVQTSLTIDGVNSDQIFDSEKSFGGLSDPVAPGQTLTVDVAFDGTGSSLVLEIGGFPYDDALFTATL